MRLILPYILLVIGITGSYYFKRFTAGQKKLVKFLIGLLLIAGWVYLIVRMI